ncbi:hypothetical protein L3X38_005532 [Prunus dulcis]|uniref:Retrotransposon Copia-like N-terminal domain-containing protein n=1 Tax=Prunus dulcis TaxID=3755 RepID=A0AAD4ZR57_PRUDU|nr:hypothetical protein L3X38_005532 [Prunus dulcis]
MGDSSGTFKVEPSSPYYINNSDHPCLVIVPKPLNGDNYATWRKFMTVSLNAKNKLGFVDGTLKRPSSESNPDEQACTTTCEIWEDLRERFSQSNAPRIFQLQRETSHLTQDQLSVTAYYTKLKGLWDELASYTDSSTCTCAAHGDCNKLMQFLIGLNEYYSAVHGQILLMNPLLSVRQAYAFISQEEKQRTLGASQAAAGTSDTATMVVRTGRPNQNRSTNHEDYRTDRSDQNRSQTSNRDDSRAGSSKNRPHCIHCDDDGHHIDTCWKLHGYPEGHPRHKPKKNHGGPSSNHVSESPTKDEMQFLCPAFRTFKFSKYWLSCMTNQCLTRNPRSMPLPPIKDLAMRKTIGLGKQHGGLYYLAALLAEKPLTNIRLTVHPATKLSPLPTFGMVVLAIFLPPY